MENQKQPGKKGRKKIIVIAFVVLCAALVVCSSDLQGTGDCPCKLSICQWPREQNHAALCILGLYHSAVEIHS